MEELSLELPSGRLQAVAHGGAGAPLVICVHGLSANARAYDFLGERLAGTGKRAVALDLRGRGLSAVTPQGSYGLAAHAADVIAAANSLEAETFDVIGWSMGALIAILTASLAAGRLRRLVQIDHAGRVDASALAAVRAGLARLDTIADDPEAYVARIREVSPIERWLPQWDAMYRREVQAAEPGRWVARTSKTACEEDLEDADHDWTEAWRPLAMPALLVRATRPYNGGFVVPEAERDSWAAHAAQPTVAEVDANHFDVMTADATWAAVEEHLA